MAAFYVGWKLWGLFIGMAAAAAVSVAAFLHERRRNRLGTVAAVSLLYLLGQGVQIIVGVITDSPTVYLAQGVIASGVSGLAFLLSAVIGRPLAGRFGLEVYPFPDEVQRSKTFRRVFGRISLVWAAYLLARCFGRLLALSTGQLGLFFLLTGVGVPVAAALMSWSLWYGVRGFRRSAEWAHLPARA